MCSYAKKKLGQKSSEKWLILLWEYPGVIHSGFGLQEVNLCLLVKKKAGW